MLHSIRSRRSVAMLIGIALIVATTKPGWRSTTRLIVIGPG